MIATFGAFSYTADSMTRGFLPDSKICWLRLLLCLLLGARAMRAGDPPPGEGEPFMQSFTPHDYHADTQCLCATQDASGVMYIGNVGAVLEYDGSTWQKIDVGQFHAIIGIDYDQRTDLVFVGGRDDLGYLKRGPGGGARLFVSLRDRLPPEARDFGAVYWVFATPEGVYFVTTNRVLRWRDGQFKVWAFAARERVRGSWVGGKLYAFSPEIGLQRLENDVFRPVSGDPLLSRVEVRAMFAAADGTVVVPTHHDGLFALRDGMLRPMDADCQEFLKAQGILRALLLHDGSMAFATETAGLLVLDRSYRFRSHVDQTGGLRGSNLLNIFEDREDGLWISLQSGVTRAEMDSPCSILRAGADDDFSDVTGDDYASDRIFFSTETGLYRLVAADPAAVRNAHLEQVPGVSGGWDAFCAVANGVLAVANDKVTFYDPEWHPATVPIAIANPVAIVPSRVHPGRVYVGGSDRIRALRFDPVLGRWTDAGVQADFGHAENVRVVESRLGDLWVASKDRGLLRVTLPAAGQAAVVSYLNRPGPMQGRHYVDGFNSGGPIVFHTQDALFQLDASGENVEPLTRFGPRFTDGSVNFYNLLCDNLQCLWVVAASAKLPAGEPISGRALAAGNGRAATFQGLPSQVVDVIGNVKDFFKSTGGTDPLDPLLLGGAAGHALVRLDVRKWEDRLAAVRPFATLIRKAVTISQQVSGGESERLSDHPLPFVRNSVHFDFAAATMALGTNPRFQTRLANFGTGEWSTFSERNSVDYLNLPEGRYVFEVRARNADGQLGSVASMPFRVLPPWQRTPWAYAAYALAAAALLAALIRWRGQQLQRRNAILETLVADRTRELRRRETELVRARDEAESANRAKSAFLANMSHELRTPLNAVLGYAQLLLKQTDLAPRSRERITVIGQSGGHLLSMVNEVLDLSKIEAGKLTLSHFDFSLSQLLDEVGAAFRPRLAEKGLSYSENRASDLPLTVHSDPSRLRQVLYNLLSNAVKFTHHGSVTLTVRPLDEKRVRFEVADTGVGIEPEDQRGIFLAFHQAGESHLASQGTGLGLTISQRLVELLGGRIEVASTPGQGSRFWFDLPLAANTPYHGLSPHGSQEAALGKVTGYEGATRRLLLVDDLTENRRVLRDFLQPLGFEIEEVADGAACLAACARQMPDAVLLDLRLGSPDGFEIARTLRARPDGAQPGLVAISASVFESDRQQAIDAGCDDFLPKPFEEAQLLAMLGRVLGLRWVREASELPEPAVSTALADGKETLPPGETELLRELSLRGDVAGIRRRLEAWRATGETGSRGVIVRRLEALVAAYDMEGIHDFLLTLSPHDGN